LDEFKQLYKNLNEKYNPIKIYNGNIDISKSNENKNFFNFFKFHVSMYGLDDLCHAKNNHLNRIEDFIVNTNSIWLLSNLYEKRNDQAPITKCNIMMIIDWNVNIKIGFIGLMNYANAAKPNPDIKYSDYVAEARYLSGELRARHVNYVVALAYMNWSDLEHLANQSSDIDMIISTDNPNTWAADDHMRIVNNKVILRNTNFKYLSLITVYFDKAENFKPVDIAISRFNASS
jgi:2',3'-cyclic-nucleotide 2'-phosphodiesterase (5'-nucleotidase family)